jgi:hypothetical protein
MSLEKKMTNILCLLGFHKWKRNNITGVYKCVNCPKTLKEKKDENTITNI